MAEAINFWSRDDGAYAGFSTNFPSSYVPPVGPGLWVPTGPQSALQPYWGQNRCFAIGTGDACDPGAPPPYSTSMTSTFYAQALEVYNTVNGLTQEQRDIANWWADGGGTVTPPGHSVSILTQIVRRDSVKLDKAAEAYAKMGIAVADAFISCWECKFRYNLLRPVTFIQANIDPNWMAFIATPPFPEYSSGHSVQSGAAATILTSLFGDDVSFTDMTNVSLGLAPRTFGSFHEAAEEAAISRLYGGIHFRAAIETGIQQGRTVAGFVNGLEWRVQP
jgi:hypothetical protein